MIFKLNLNFVYGANLSAKLLNKIVNKLNEIGGLVEITFNDGNPLCADDLNLIIDSTNNLILDDWNLPKLDNLSDGEYLCADVLNKLVYIINEIIKHINLKDDIYDLKVLIYSDTRFTYKGGLFILDAYITKNGKYYTREGIEFISSLVNNNGTFNIPEVTNATNYLIKINSEYGSKTIELIQEGKPTEEEPVYEIYVSEYPHSVSADGGEIEIVVSILKNGKNYTTLGLNVDIQYPYKISSVYRDNGVERVYLFKFEPNISFDLKNLIGTVSAISLESKLINIIQPCQDVDSVIRVHANGSRVIPYNTTEVSFSFYAVVNRKTVDSGVVPEIVSNEVDAVLKDSTNSTATYIISENNGETDRELILLASYQGVKSGEILIIQKAKSEDINYQINSSILSYSTSKEGRILGAPFLGPNTIIFDEKGILKSIEGGISPITGEEPYKSIYVSVDNTPFKYFNGGKYIANEMDANEHPFEFIITPKEGYYLAGVCNNVVDESKVIVKNWNYDQTESKLSFVTVYNSNGTSIYDSNPNCLISFIFLKPHITECSERLSLEGYALDFEPNGGTKSITCSTPKGDTLYISSSSDWASGKLVNGNLEITTTLNTNTESRLANIEITIENHAECDSLSILVTLKGRDLTCAERLKVDKSSITILSNGTGDTITCTTDEEIAVSSNIDWLNITIRGKVVLIDASENISTLSRTAQISIYLTNHTECSQNISITLSGKEISCDERLVIDTSDISFSSSGGNKSLSYSTPYNDEIQITNNNSWLSIQKSNSTINLSVLNNSETSSRNGVINIKTSSCPEKTISITQEGNNVTIPYSVYYVDVGSTINITKFLDGSYLDSYKNVTIVFDNPNIAEYWELEFAGTMIRGFRGLSEGSTDATITADGIVGRCTVIVKQPTVFTDDDKHWKVYVNILGKVFRLERPGTASSTQYPLCIFNANELGISGITTDDLTITTRGGSGVEPNWFTLEDNQTILNVIPTKWSTKISLYLSLDRPVNVTDCNDKRWAFVTITAKDGSYREIEIILESYYAPKYEGYDGLGSYFFNVRGINPLHWHKVAWYGDSNVTFTDPGTSNSAPLKIKIKNEGKFYGIAYPSDSTLPRAILFLENKYSTEYSLFTYKYTTTL